MSEPIECIICYERIGDKNCCTTDCGHKFCFKCIATAMQYNNACPYCRMSLVDIPDEEEEEDEDEEEEEEEEEDEYNDEENEADVENIVARMQRKGISMLDVVSLLIGRYSKTRETLEVVENGITTLHQRVWDVIIEADEEVIEQNNMMDEDIRSKAIDLATVFEMNV